MNKIKNAKDKVVGETKEAIGKVTNNKELEIKGKIQSTMADVNIKGEKIKDDVNRKVNKAFDKK
ncbi:MAG: CsbD family protein [Erysipelotrichaceae bacterium]|nr:CsbD family protein [Erysipelotrichaceae bacterium]MDP3306387.1 CsbD family protein [Erysipelotrichaceae bacterium]